jgi:cold shock CspA family protein
MANDSGRRRAARPAALALAAKGRSQGMKGMKVVVNGQPMTGRISGLSYGNGTGFIRAADGRRVYFHRADVEGGSFNALEAGDAVAFDMVEDQLSGLRALRIRTSRFTTVAPTGRLDSDR